MATSSGDTSRASDLVSDLDKPGRRAEAAERLLPLVYDELRALAAGYLSNERCDHTLQATALVHEAFLRLVRSNGVSFESRAHFFAVAATAIRCVLVDHARKHGAHRRGGGWQRVTLSGCTLSDRPPRPVEVLAVDEAMRRLTDQHVRPGRVAELRFFGGLTLEETALVLEVSRKTVTEDWHFARAWLSRALSDE